MAPIRQIRFGRILFLLVLSCSFFLLKGLADDRHILQEKSLFRQDDVPVLAGSIIKYENVSGTVERIHDRQFLLEGSPAGSQGAVERAWHAF